MGVEVRDLGHGRESNCWRLRSRRSSDCVVLPVTGPTTRPPPLETARGLFVYTRASPPFTPRQNKNRTRLTRRFILSFSLYLVTVCGIGQGYSRSCSSYPILIAHRRFSTTSILVSPVASASSPQQQKTFLRATASSPLYPAPSEIQYHPRPLSFTISNLLFYIDFPVLVCPFDPEPARLISPWRTIRRLRKSERVCITTWHTGPSHVSLGLATLG